MRLPTTSYVYDDPEHPNRVTSTIQSPAWTPEDRALLMGLELYESELCNCGHPRSVAWHSEMDGFYEPESFLCHACTARAGGKQVVYTITRNTRPDTKGEMPPFQLGVTTTEPDSPIGGARP